MAPLPFKYIEYKSRCAESVWIRGQAGTPADPSKAYPESFRELKPGASVRFPDGTGFWPFAPENQRIEVTPAPSSAGQTTFLELTGTVSPAPGGGYVFKEGVPHPNFVEQMGFIDLNLEVSFDDARGDPFCTAPGAYSRARTGHQTSACDGLGAIDGSARLEKQAAGAVCRPYCPDEGEARFTRPLTSNAPPPGSKVRPNSAGDWPDCAACTIKNRTVDGHLEPVQLNAYARYLAQTACVWDPADRTWKRSPYSVGTQAQFLATGARPREWNPALNNYDSRGAGIFECWDRFGCGSEGLLIGCDAEASKLDHISVTVCPPLSKCAEPFPGAWDGGGVAPEGGGGEGGGVAPEGGGGEGGGGGFPLVPLLLILLFLAALAAGGAILARRAEARKRARPPAPGS